jgi:GT2 family glycosyltransferase
VSSQSRSAGTTGDTSGRIGDVTLVVPMRDEVGSLRSLIDSIRRQSRAPDEVVLVDGGSTDGTVALATELVGSEPLYRVVEAGQATPGRGRNVGIEAASHEWIALTDCGIVLEPEWLAELEVVARDAPSAGVVWGSYEPTVRTFLDSCAALAYVAPRRATPAGAARGPSVASCLLRREAWAAAAGFPDLRAAEDLVFIERLAAAGVEAAWAPGAVAWWSLPSTLGATFRRFRSYSRHNVLAGRQADWHYGVARIYVAAVAVALAALVLDRRLTALLAAGVAARLAETVRKHAGDRPLSFLLNPARLGGVAVLLATVDAATFLGWADAIRERRRTAVAPTLVSP